VCKKLIKIPNQLGKIVRKPRGGVDSHCTMACERGIFCHTYIVDLVKTRHLLRIRFSLSTALTVNKSLDFIDDVKAAGEYFLIYKTRSQAVARIADRIASQQTI